METPLDKIDKFTIESDKNNLYEIEILEKSSLYINIFRNTNNFSKKYSNNFSLEEIKKYKYFLICNNISDVIIFLAPIIKDKNNIKLKENINELVLTINLPNPLCPFIKFNIKEINEKEEVSGVLLEHNEKISKLYEIIENQQKTITAQENKIKMLEEKIDKLDKKFSNYFEKEENNNFQSIIIGNNENQINKIKSWINPNKNIKLNLIYKMSRDGEKISDFNRLCTYKGPTLILFETENNYKFGGYTTLDWEIVEGNEGNYIEKFDKETFLFSLNLMKKYPKKKNKENDRSIVCKKNYGPGFGNGGDIRVGPDTMKKGYGYPGYTFLDTMELAGGKDEKYNFLFKEIEVFIVN